MDITHRRIGAASDGVRRLLSSGLRGLRAFLIGGDTARPASNRTRRALAWTFASAAAAYLAYGASTHLEAKSGLPSWACLIGGTALAAPLLLVVARPLLAWRLAWIAAVVTGTAVQAHGRTPFSWHPAVFVALMLILFVVALRHPVAVSGWALASMVALIWVSFYPADRFGLAVLVAGLVAIAWLVRRRRARSTAAAVAAPPGAVVVDAVGAARVS